MKKFLTLCLSLLLLGSSLLMTACDSPNGTNQENRIPESKLEFSPTLFFSSSSSAVNSSYFVCGMGDETKANIFIPAWHEGLPVVAISGFENCTQLKSVDIANGITDITGNAFSGCTALKDINIPDSIISISADAFEGCSALIEYEKGVYYVDKWVIDCDPSITTAKLRKNTTGIADEAFKDCTSLTNIILSDSVTYIGAGAFQGCTALASVIMPDSVTRIGASAFQGCTTLASVIMPDSVTRIGTSAFQGCTALTNINIPNSISNLYKKTFENCSKLIEYEDGVYYIDNWVIDCDPSVTIVNLRANTVGIAEMAFGDSSMNSRNPALTSITIPNSVTSISDAAFAYCRNLTSITIPSSVTSINYGTFAGCESLTSITIPNSVTSISYNAFAGCESLTNITIPNSVTILDYGVFRGCKNLTSITLPSSITNISLEPFAKCSSLTDIIFHGSKEEWNAIKKEENWNQDTGYYTIHCTDGNITK